MRIKKVDHLEGFKLKIKFNDNKVKIVDFWPLIKDSSSVYFIPLKDIEYFKKAYVDPDFITVVWPNEADFCPDLLYEIGIETKDEKYSSSKILSKTILRQPAHALSKKIPKKNKNKK